MPVTVIELPTATVEGVIEVIVGAEIEKFTAELVPPLLPLTVTVTPPETVPLGTTTVSCVEEAVVGVAVAPPPKVTVLLVVVVLKLVPVMVIVVPIGPELGLIDEIVGAAASALRGARKKRSR